MNGKVLGFVLAVLIIDFYIKTNQRRLSHEEEF